MFELADINDTRYRIPASITVDQLHVGGTPRIRFVRGYGKNQWFTAQDGIREPAPVNLVGMLHTDRDETEIQTLINDLQAALNTATALVQLDANGNDAAELALRGALPITTNPDGIDGTLLTITAPLLLAGTEWVPIALVTRQFSDAFNSAFHGGLGSPQHG